MINLRAYKKSTVDNSGLKQLEEKGSPKSVTLKDLPYSAVNLHIMSTVSETMEKRNESNALIRLYSGLEGISIRSIEISENPVEEADGFEVKCGRVDIEDWLQSYLGPLPAKRVLQ